MGDDGIEVEGRTFAGPAMRQPNGSDCEKAAQLHREGLMSRWLPHFYETICQLMLAGFCLLFYCSPSIADEPVQSGCYLVAFTTEYCSDCQRWERDQLPTLESAGHKVTFVDAEFDDRWRVEYVPTFWVVDRRTKKVVRRFVGLTKAEVLLPLIKVRR